MSIVWVAVALAYLIGFTAGIWITIFAWSLGKAWERHDALREIARRP